MIKYSSHITTAVFLALAALPASAALTSISLPGTTQNDTWANGSLTATSANAAAGATYPGFPGTGNWPAPIGSPTGGDATLSKTANGPGGGGPYPAGASIYYGGFSSALNLNGGTLSVTDSSPVAGLATIVFQVEIGEAWTYDFFNRVLPTLSYNGGTQSLAATYTSIFSKVDNGVVSMPTGPETVYINTYALQWDVSSLGAISDFSIAFTAVQHAQLYALQLDQGSTAADRSLLPAAVPEPSSLAFLTAGLGLLLRRRRQA